MVIIPKVRKLLLQFSGFPPFLTRIKNCNTGKAAQMGNISTVKDFDVITMSRTERHKEKQMMLLVGESGQVKRFPAISSELTGILYVEFQALSPELFSALKPDLVMSEAIGQTFDCLELAGFLDQAGFVGKYRIMLDDIPRPEIICREVRHLHPMLDFGVAQPHGSAISMQLN
ncbi:hypothetical protein [Pacificibacter marinus]|nr:hypothetical protein [Pacificibacter marinus]